MPLLTILSHAVLISKPLLSSPRPPQPPRPVSSFHSNKHLLSSIKITLPSSSLSHSPKATLLLLLSRSAFMADDQTPESSLSFKEKLKSSLCFLCCFHHHHIHHQHDAVKPKLVRSSSLQHKPSRSYDLPHLKEKCSNFISRIGRHRRRHSADFHYDALSYALNFEDGAIDDDRPAGAGDFRNFSARLPLSPPPKISSDPKTTGNSPLLVDL